MQQQFSTSERARFWGHVRRTDTCWLWIPGPSNRYGVFFLRKKKYGAHRVSWTMHFGTIPDGLWVLHSCDTPRCVRPEHLFLGTQLENMRDASAKKRLRLGEHHPHHKLTDEIVVAARAEYATGVTSYQLLATKYGVDYRTIYDAVRRNTWRENCPRVG